MPWVRQARTKSGRPSTLRNAVFAHAESEEKNEIHRNHFCGILSGKHRLGAKRPWLGSRSRRRLQNGSRQSSRRCLEQQGEELLSAAGSEAKAAWCGRNELPEELRDHRPRALSLRRFQIFSK
jgi:hypothetical protein